jgi:hypothetical protein
MASQLRLQVLLPVAVLGILGLGVGAFATTRSTPDTSAADAIAARIAAKQAEKENDGTKPRKDRKPDKPADPAPKTTPLQDALRKDGVVVVLFYSPGSDYDTIQTRETRAGALAADAGFLALDVTKNRRVGALAAQYEVLRAPATLIFTRGPRIAYKASGYMDRLAVEQAAANARA